MFGIGWSEFLVIALVATVLIGPKDLPRFLYSAGKVFKKIKVFGTDMQASLDRIMQEEELNDIIRTANVVGDDELQKNIEEQVVAIEKKKVKTGEGL